MTIRRFYYLFTLSMMLLLLMVGIIIFITLSHRNNMAKTEQHRYRAFSLAIELLQNTEDLSRTARSFISTGSPAYEKRYNEILDIRSGRLPRSQKTALPFWYLSGAGRITTVAAGETVPLQVLIRHEGLTEHEISLLQESQRSADRLVTIEKQALAAMKGLYEDGSGAYTLVRSPDRSYAANLLLSQKYADEKSRITMQIQQCMDEIDARTESRLSVLESGLRRYILISLIFIGFTLCAIAVILSKVFISILQPLEQLRSQVADLSQGNYKARCDIRSSSEIGELCMHFNEMAAFIEGDILRREKDEERIRHMAQHDILTGLPNRALFSDRLTQAIAAARRNKTYLAVMCLDLDKFKQINDTLGHAAGDDLLSEAARRMQNCVRETDTIARIGGDEFVVLLHTLHSYDDALAVAEKIRHVLNQPFPLAGQNRRISSSIGISIYPAHGNDEISLTKNADSALYYAKECGRNNVKLFQSTAAES